MDQILVVPYKEPIVPRECYYSTVWYPFSTLLVPEEFVSFQAIVMAPLAPLREAQAQMSRVL